MTVPPLFHIVDRHAWRAAVAAGLYRPESLGAEGFVHCSFAEQVLGTADTRFAGVAGLIVVEFDPRRVGPVRVEDSYGEGREFPHVYAAIPTSAAVAVAPLEPGTDGFSWTGPAGPGGAASPDR